MPRTGFVSVRVDPETLESLDRISDRHGVSRSVLVRLALERMAEAETQGKTATGYLPSLVDMAQELGRLQAEVKALRQEYRRE